MLAEISAIILSPAGLAVGVIYAVLSQIIVQSLTLVFRNSKNAILRFAFERSEGQKRIRQQRIVRMKRDIKAFHLYISELNFNLHMATAGLVLTGACVLSIIVIRRSDTFNDPTAYLFLGGFTAIFSIYLIFQAMAIHQDLIRSVPELPRDDDDDDKAPPVSSTLHWVFSWWVVIQEN